MLALVINVWYNMYQTFCSAQERIPLSPALYTLSSKTGVNVRIAIPNMALGPDLLFVCGMIYGSREVSTTKL